MAIANEVVDEAAKRGAAQCSVEMERGGLVWEAHSAVRNMLHCFASILQGRRAGRARMARRGVHDQAGGAGRRATSSSGTRRERLKHARPHVIYSAWHPVAAAPFAGSQSCQAENGQKPTVATHGPRALGTVRSWRRPHEGLKAQPALRARRRLVLEQ